MTLEALDRMISSGTYNLSWLTDDLEKKWTYAMANFSIK